MARKCPAAWALLAAEQDCSGGAVRTDSSLSLCLQVAGDCRVTPASLLQLSLLACPAAVRTCSLVHLKCRVAGLCPAGCGGTPIV